MENNLKKHDEVCLNQMSLNSMYFIRNINDEVKKKKLNTITNKVNNNKIFKTGDTYDIAFTAIFASDEITEDEIKKAVE